MENHTEYPKITIGKFYHPNPEERFANMFAAAILMPLTKMREALKLTDDPHTIANIFQVPVDIAEHRITYVKGIISGENGMIDYIKKNT